MTAQPCPRCGAIPATESGLGHALLCSGALKAIVNSSESTGSDGSQPASEVKETQ